MRIAFAGTPEFAAVALEALIAAGHDICLVLTQPDRPSGRGMKLKPSAVKEVALRHGYPVLTPATLSIKRNPQEASNALQALEDCQADVLVVAAYGLILPQRALDAARGIGQNADICSINIHGSLLPRWRGAAPVQRAIMAGDAQTGVTLMHMQAGLDTGPMIVKSTTDITEADTTASLTDRLARMGADLIVEALSHPDTLSCTPQPEEGVTYAHKVTKTESPIDWTLDAECIARRVRALTPFPSTTGSFQGEVFKIRAAHAVDGNAEPGQILATGKSLVIACGKGALECTRLQRAGKAEMPAQAFLQSLPLQVGQRLDLLS